MLAIVKKKKKKKSVIYPGMKLPGHMVVLFWWFEKIPYFFFPQWMCQFAFPPTMNKGSFLCRKIQPIFVICAVSDDNDSDRYEMTFHCGCDFHFMMVPFMYLLAIYICSWGGVEYIYIYLVLLIFNLIFLFFDIEFMSCLCMLYINPLSVTPFANIFSHTVGCFLVLSIVAFFVKKLLNLIRSNFFVVVVCFYFLHLEYRSKAITTIWKRGFCLCFPHILQYLVPTLQADSLPSESPGKICSNVLISSFACSCSVLHCFVVQLPSGIWLCHPMDCRTPGFPILNYLPKFAQIHVHCIGNDIQLSHPLIPSSPFALNLSEHQGLFQWVCIRWPKYWSFSFIISPSKEYSRLIYLKIDWFDLLAVQGTSRSLLQHHKLKALILWCSSFFIVSSHIHTWPLGRCVVKAMVFPVLHMKKLSFLHCVVLPPLS